MSAFFKTFFCMVSLQQETELLSRKFHLHSYTSHVSTYNQSSWDHSSDELRAQQHAPFTYSPFIPLHTCTLPSSIHISDRD